MNRDSPIKPSIARRVYRHWSFRLVLLVLAVLVVRSFQQRGVVEGKAPPLEGYDLQEEAISLGQLEGKTVLVHFWATWCGVCRTMADNVQSVSRDHAVIAVASQSGSAAEVAAYLEKEGLSLPVLLDPEGTLASDYGVSALPTSFVIDRSGRIRSAEVGYTTEIGLRLRLWLAE